MKYAIATVAIAFSSLLAASPAIASPVTEDDPSWDCRTMGNQICGATNAQGVQAGQYRDGALIAWPHETVPAWCSDICLGS